MTFVALSFGHALLALKTCCYPVGNEGIEYVANAKDITKTTAPMGISDAHFWHHYYSAQECIYRVFERCTNLLLFACSLDKPFYDKCGYKRKNRYFNDLINEIKEDETLSKNIQFEALKKYESIRNTIAEKRNIVSHRTATALKGLDVEAIGPTGLFNMLGEKIYKLKCKYPSLDKEIENLKCDYEHAFNLVLCTKNFIDNI